MKIPPIAPDISPWLRIQLLDWHNAKLEAATAMLLSAKTREDAAMAVIVERDVTRHAAIIDQLRDEPYTRIDPGTGREHKLIDADWPNNGRTA